MHDCTNRIIENTESERESQRLILLSVMHKDVRYKAVRDLIKTNSINEFRQIFDTLPKSIIAKELRKNTNRIDDLIEHPEELRYKEIRIISAYLEVPCSMIIKLIDKQFA